MVVLDTDGDGRVNLAEFMEGLGAWLEWLLEGKRN